MDFELAEDQTTIRKAVRELAAKFDDQYWLERDAAHEFPAEFCRTFAGAGDVYYADEALVTSFLCAAHRAAGLGDLPADETGEDTLAKETR